jgi:four helix bundle protein
MMKGQDISDRLVAFGSALLALARRLPSDEAGRRVSRQLLRVGTSAGANYEEARSGESPADFLHKVGVAAKECREALYWLRLVETTGLVAESVATLCAVAAPMKATRSWRSSRHR